MNDIEGKKGSGGLNRRSFIDVCLGGTLTFLAALTGYSFLRYIWPSKATIGEEKGSEQATIPSVELPVGEAKLLRYAGRPVIVVRTDERSVSALSAVCTHLGCIVKWDRSRGQLACPCHAAFFDSKGNVISGPAPRPLESYPAKLGMDTIVIGEA